MWPVSLPLGNAIAWTHTHTHTTLLPRLPGWAGTRKVKPIWVLLEQETVSGSSISWAVCKSASRSRQITMPVPHHSKFFSSQMPFLPPNQQRQSTKDWRHTLKAYTIAWTVGYISFIHPTDKSVLSLLRQLSVWCCLHLLLSAGAHSTPTVYTCPSISSAHRVLSSKLAIHHCCCRSMGQTDGRRTPDGYIVVRASGQRQ